MLDSPERMNPRERRFNEVLGAYLEAVDAGWAPAPEGLMHRYPDFADDLEVFFSVQAQVAGLACPLPLAKSNGTQRTPSSEPQTLPLDENKKAAATPVDALTAVGDYESLEVIKPGGMGIVYKAYQKRAKRWVALKMILAGRLATANEVRRFQEETEAAAHLDHPNIVPIYEVGEHHGQPYFSMKLFETGNLSQHLQRYTDDPRAAAKLLATVARAVHHAHQRGILHRDLKPANILLDAQGQPHVADFGLAKRLFPAAPPARPTGGAGDAVGPKQNTLSASKTPGSDTSGPEPLDFVRYMAPEQVAGTEDGTTLTVDVSLTATGAGLGTLGYMPPEHAGTTKMDVSTAADVYSLGAILYRLLAGKTLFQAATKQEALRLAREGVPEMPHLLNPRADRKLEAICMKCLQRDPTQRYPSAEALAEDLERWLNGEPPRAWQQPRWYRAWRAVRRYFLVGMLTALISFAAAAAFFSLYYFDPERLPAALEREANRQRVFLIGETGHPKWSRWNVGQGTVWITPEADKPFSFTTLELGRLELLRHPPLRYRFAAEIRHEMIVQGWGAAGIYFANFERKTEQGINRYWWDLEFADLGSEVRRHDGPDKLKYSEVRLIPRRYALPGKYFEQPADLFQPFLSAQEAKVRPSWRKLAVQVRPEQIQFSWDDKPFRAVSVDEMRKFGEPFVSRTGEVIFPEIEFRPEAALGIFVSKGKASFRNVMVEPLE